METPAGSEKPKRKKREVPARKRRYSFYEDGLDHVILSVQRDESGKAMVNGALSPVPDVPRFASAKDALEWISTQSGNALAGLSVLVVKMEHKIMVVVENRPAVTVHAAPKFAREPNAASEGESTAA